MTRKFYSFLFPVLVLVAVTSCKDSIMNDPVPNQSPNTTIFLDTTDVKNYVSVTEMTLFWNGDDPDGEVVGYLYSLDSLETWQFTTQRKLTVVIPTKGLDTLITKIFVAAIDNSGNGRFDSQVTYLGKNIGNEFFTDSDSNGVFNSGEPFIDFGAIDPTPDGFSIKIKNTAPVAYFNAASKIPAVTLPVASFILEGFDADGSSSLKNVELALNDTSESNWISLPPKTRIVTLKGDLKATGTKIAASVLIGSELAESGISIPNLKLNALNVLYYRLVDNTNARSKIASMPDQSTTATWQVNQSKSGGELLVIRAHELGDRDSLRSLLKQAPATVAGESYANSDFLSLQNPDFSQTIPQSIRLVLLRATVLSFRKLIWYGLTNPDVAIAQSIIPFYLNKGGKALVRIGFTGNENELDFEALRFLPIDSLNRKYYPATGPARNGYHSTLRADRYLVKEKPTLSDSAFIASLPAKIGTKAFIGNDFGFFSFVPSSQATVLYRFDLPASNDIWPVNVPLYKGIGTPVLVLENLERNLVFTTAPLPNMTQIPPGTSYPKVENGKTYNNPAVELVSKILSQEFERPTTRR
ncbi:MAG: hypothetical protein LCH54_15900 [Bacteroidetes bacterium]|nr:hypothetical protein [Bacteroidota bacterium]